MISSKSVSMYYRFWNRISWNQNYSFQIHWNELNLVYRSWSKWSWFERGRILGGATWPGGHRVWAVIGQRRWWWWWAAEGSFWPCQLLITEMDELMVVQLLEAATPSEKVPFPAGHHHHSLSRSLSVFLFLSLLEIFKRNLWLTKIFRCISRQLTYVPFCLVEVWKF